MASGPKLNSSFPVAQFKMNGYKTFRYDHNSFVAGIMLYINEDILCKLLNNFSVESLFANVNRYFHEFIKLLLKVIRTVTSLIHTCISRKVYSLQETLRSDSHPPKKIVLLASMKTLFILSKKFFVLKIFKFLFEFLVMMKKHLD